ncbi:MAG: aminotransferase class V-fold PLP-dependent enzyme [Gemmatimonadales bacterium]
MTDFAALRRDEFSALDGHGIYMNMASVGPVPRRSVSALEVANRDRARPSTWTGDRLDGVLADARRTAARLINAQVGEIALMPNTTTGLNIAARALPLGAGDIVLTFDREFPAVLYPWMARSGEGIVVERIPCTAEGWPDEARLYERLRDPAVRAVCVSLTQFINGYTIDLGALSRATRAGGQWLIIDAIQACGQVPVDVVATPVDFLACGAQKWLMSPWGTGFLYVREALIADITPTFVGWAAYRSSADYTQLTSYDPEPWDDARRFELITLPVQDLAAMTASIELLLEVGIETVAAHLAALQQPILEAARGAGLVIKSPHDARGSGIVAVAGRTAAETAALHERLTLQGVICSSREGAVRLSPGVCTEIEEARVLAEAVSSVVRGGAHVG